MNDLVQQLDQMIAEAQGLCDALGVDPESAELVGDDLTWETV